MYSRTRIHIQFRGGFNIQRVRFREVALYLSDPFPLSFASNQGEIRATAFNETAERLHRQFELDKVYFVSRCQVKTANKQFTSLKNDYEITFRDDSEVEEVTCISVYSGAPLFQTPWDQKGLP